MKHTVVMLSITSTILLLVACNKLLPSSVAEDQTLDGPIEGLTGEQHIQFLAGDRAFNDEVFTRETGLGPLFVATTCGSCHNSDGKGHPFAMLTRFGQSDTVSGNQFLNRGGPQLQHVAIPGFQPEVLPAGTVSANFLAPSNTGLGLLDAVPDSILLVLSDPFDADGDGISGRPNWISIPSYVSLRNGSVSINHKYIGRFGKKAATYDLLQQTAVAYNQDIGIVSSYEPIDTYSGTVTDPEISNKKVLDVVFYLKTLKAPIQRNPNLSTVKEGKQIFVNIGCAKCHTPTLTTGASTISALSNISFSPYSDLLLHDMGDQLNDGYTEGTALAQEWRTAPLWGLGLAKRSQGNAYFLLHDGRAHSIEAAIELHGGESSKSRSNYVSLGAADKQKLLAFIESL